MVEDLAWRLMRGIDGSMQVEIGRIDKRAKLPRYQTEGAACFDIETLEETRVSAGKTTLLRTGLVVKTPPGYFLAIAPRSSMAKIGLRMPHSFGILDPDYCGFEDELKILVENVTKRPIVIEAGQRVAQGFFVATPKVDWREIDAKKLRRESREGFGSTG